MARDHPLGCPNRSTVVLLVQTHKEKKIVLVAVGFSKSYQVLVCSGMSSRPEQERQKFDKQHLKESYDTGQHNDIVITLVS